jgi:uncharacterized protein YecE (DUF72 family)
VARPRGIYVGTQGFAYPEWTGLVYPPGIKDRDRLTHYARHFNILELDTTYYAVPSPQNLARWAGMVPEGFVFSSKVPQAVTRGKLVAETWPELGRFFEVMRLLDDHLGPIVFQMSPGFVFPRDWDGLEQTMRQLRELGGEGLDLALEVRHPSWLKAEGLEPLLREAGVAWCWNDWLPERPGLRAMPRAIDEPAAHKVTSDAFVYARLNGDHGIEIDRRRVIIDRGRDLARWAELALAFRRNREDRGIYILLNNHYSGSSALSAQELQRIFELPVVEFGTPGAADLVEAAAPADGVRQLGLF